VGEDGAANVKSLERQLSPTTSIALPHGAEDYVRALLALRPLTANVIRTSNARKGTS